MVISRDQGFVAVFVVILFFADVIVFVVFPFQFRVSICCQGRFPVHAKVFYDDRLAVFPDLLTEGMISSCQKYFAAFGVKIGFFNGFAVLIHLTHNDGIPGRNVYQFIVCPVILNVHGISAGHGGSRFFRLILFFRSLFCFLRLADHFFRLFRIIDLFILILPGFRIFSQIVLILLGDCTNVSVILSRSVVQFPVRAVVQRRHNLTLAVVLFLHLGISVR